MKKAIISILALLLAALGGSQVANLGGSPGNLPSEIATSSTVSVGSKSVNVLFATTTVRLGSNALCSSRVVSTVADPILIQFSPGITEGPHGTTSLQLGFGHLQAASTTVSYQAEDYGCGAWIVTGQGASGASTTISVTEFRQ